MNSVITLALLIAVTPVVAISNQRGSRSSSARQIDTWYASESPLLNAAECEGNACGVVAKRYDGNSNTYYFKNNSSDRRVKVELDGIFIVGNSFELNPGEEKAAFLKTFKLPYKANYL